MKTQMVKLALFISCCRSLQVSEPAFKTLYYIILKVKTRAKET